MFRDGAPGSGPQRSPFGRVASEASDGVLVDCVRTIKSEMKACARKGRRLCGPECQVHVQCSTLDKEEMLGYLLGDIYGLPLIPQPFARTVGEEARLRANKAEPPIAAAERRLGKAAGDAALEASSALEALRARVVIEPTMPTSRRAIAAGMDPIDAKQEIEEEAKVDYYPAAQPAPPEVLAEAYLFESQRAKWAADAELKAATRALARLQPPPNFNGVREERGIRYWLAGDTLDPGTPAQLAERARRDALREDLHVAKLEHIRAKHAASRAAKDLAEAQELMGMEPELEVSAPSVDEICPPNPELQTEQEELDYQWELLELQREADEDFARTCEQRRAKRREYVEACQSHVDQMRRDETRRRLHADAEAVWGPDWQSK